MSAINVCCEAGAGEEVRDGGSEVRPKVIDNAPLERVEARPRGALGLADEKVSFRFPECTHVFNRTLYLCLIAQWERCLHG